MKLNKMKAVLVISVVCLFVVLIFGAGLKSKNDGQKETTGKKHQIAQEMSSTETEQTMTQDMTEAQTPKEPEVQTTEEMVEQSEPQTGEQTTQKSEPQTEEQTTEKVELQSGPDMTLETGQPVSLSFVGDFYLSPQMYQNYQSRGISGIISEKIQEIFNTVDICVADHEYVSGDLPEENKVNYQQYTFLTPAYRESILPEFSFDVMSVANNHMMDYGTAGLQSTLSLVREQGIGAIGGGNNLSEAMKPYTAHINGKKIAIIAATRVVPQTDWYAGANTAGLLTTYESTDRFAMIKNEITRLKTQEDYDIVILYVHWGNDSQTPILDNQVTLGHGYIDAGADIVIGNHTHRLQGMEYYNGKLICYGLSNFLFGTYHSDTMVLTLSIAEDNRITAKMLPCSSEAYYTHDLQGEDAQAIFRYVESMSTHVKFLEDGTIVEQ